MSVILKMFILPKRRIKMQIRTKKNIFCFGRSDKDLTLLLHISIRDGKSGLRSSLIVPDSVLQYDAQKQVNSHLRHEADSSGIEKNVVVFQYHLVWLSKYL